jgi:hypothetical protein
MIQIQIQELDGAQKGLKIKVLSVTHSLRHNKFFAFS